MDHELAEIVVTGARLRTVPDYGGQAGIISVAAYVPPAAPDLFAQYGGGETPQTVQFALINGDVVVTLPGYDFTFRLPAADWQRMSAQQRGEFIKVMNEFHESPMLTATLNYLATHNLPYITVRYDSTIYNADGSTENWKSTTHYERMSVRYRIDPTTNQMDLSKIEALVININPNSDTSGALRTTPSGQVYNVGFGHSLMHALRHSFYPGAQPGEEDQVRSDTGQMYQDIFFTNGSERSPQEYINGLTIAGSMYDDNATGSSAGDTLSGLSGNDTLNGAGGDDLVMGGAGMDRLSGGTGTNLVEGGLDADTYVVAVGVTYDQITDIGGVDRLDLSAISIADAIFSRYGDDLFISAPGLAVEGVGVTGQWIDANRIEQFTFAEGTYGASYIESLADSPAGVCFDEFGQLMMCDSYGMPVVLDLDDDGIELVDVSRSRARFDVNSDGAKERIGWVGRDDGILALDRNGNGRIDDFAEISFRHDFRGAGTDLEGLMAYDSDGDGFLTAADDRFLEFLVWRDGNGNGRSEKHELFTLEELGIVSIGLERSNRSTLDTGADANQILATSVFRTVDGKDHLLGDVALFAELADCGCDPSFAGSEWLQPEWVVP